MARKPGLPLALSLLAACFGAASAGPARAQEAAGHVVVFEQPVLRGIEDNFHVPKAEHHYPRERTFNVLLWQPNPERADGELVPARWKAGDMTGFYPGEPIAEHQAAFRDAEGASTVQIQDDTVGAYLNTRDLPASTPYQKMMVTPEFKPKEAIFPFKQPGTELEAQLELQVPVAKDENRPGSYTYVVSDMLFRDAKTGLQLTLGVRLFHHKPGRAPATLSPEEMRRTEIGKFDVPGQTFQIGNLIAPGSRVFTVMPGSTTFQTGTWTGWRPFRYAVTWENFRDALHDLREKGEGFHGSEDPADYKLINWHLNAEVKFGSAPAELGWSMRHARLEVAPERMN